MGEGRQTKMVRLVTSKKNNCGRLVEGQPWGIE
jgi:hypothetical protein